MPTDVNILKIDISPGAYYELYPDNNIFSIITNIKTFSLYLHDYPSVYYWITGTLGWAWYYSPTPIIWNKWGIGTYKILDNNNTEEYINGMFPLIPTSYIKLYTDRTSFASIQSFSIRFYNRTNNNISSYVTYYYINTQELISSYCKIYGYFTARCTNNTPVYTRTHTVNFSKKQNVLFVFTYNRNNNYTNYLLRFNDYITTANIYNTGMGIAGAALNFPCIITNKATFTCSPRWDHVSGLNPPENRIWGYPNIQNVFFVMTVEG